MSVMVYSSFRLVFGTLYPAYASYKAIKTRSNKEYLKWMMYWIVMAFFSCVETIADIFVAWLPFYYELKILFVLWLLSPATKGSTILYRKLVHPQLAKRETEIDSYLQKASDQGYSAILSLGSRGFSYVTNVAMTTAIKGQAQLADKIKKSYSMNDISPDQLDGAQRRTSRALREDDEITDDEEDNRRLQEEYEQEMMEKDSADGDVKRSSSLGRKQRPKSLHEQQLREMDEEDMEGDDEDELIQGSKKKQAYSHKEGSKKRKNVIST